MAGPKTQLEFEARYKASERVTGHGLETTVHYPCPFCGAPDGVVAKVLDTAAALARGGTCAECGRSWRLPITYAGGGVSISPIQTGGPDAPAWVKVPRGPPADESPAPPGPTTVLTR